MQAWRARVATSSGCSSRARAHSRVGSSESPGRAGLDHRALDELRLAAVAMRRDDGAPGELGGDRRAVVAPDHVQAQVQPGGDTGAGQHRPLVDVQDRRVDVDLGVAPGQLGREGPVGGGAPAVEQPGPRQRERARCRSTSRGRRRRGRLRSAAVAVSGATSSLPGTTIVSARRSASRPAGATRSKPVEVVTGPGRRAGQLEAVPPCPEVAEQVRGGGQVEQDHAGQGERDNPVGRVAASWHESYDTWHSCHLYGSGPASTMCP